MKNESYKMVKKSKVKSCTNCKKVILKIQELESCSFFVLIVLILNKGIGYIYISAIIHPIAQISIGELYFVESKIHSAAR